MTRQRTKKAKSKKAVFIILAIILLAGAATGAHYLLADNSETLKSSSKYTPPTKEEKQQVEDHKDQLEKENDQPGAPESSATSVIITYANQQDQSIIVSSYVNGIIEQGGTCTVKLTKAAQDIVRSATALLDAKHTTCPTITIPRSDFSESGDWSLIVSYNSSNTPTVSASQKVKVE